MPSVVIPTTGYPSAADIVAASGDPALIALTPEEAEAIWASSIRAIESYCGQSFGEPYDGPIEVQTMRSDTLYLPRRIITIVSIIPTGGDPYELSAIVSTHDGGRLVWKRDVVGVGYYQQALQEVSGYSYPSAFSESWVIIDGHWGWDSCPPAVVDALEADMSSSASSGTNDLTATVNYMRAMGIDRISQGNLDLSLSAMPSLTPEVMGLLEGYVFRGTPPGRMV